MFDPTRVESLSKVHGQEQQLFSVTRTFFTLSHSTGAPIAAEDTGLTSVGSGPHGHKGPGSRFPTKSVESWIKLVEKACGTAPASLDRLVL